MIRTHTLSDDLTLVSMSDVDWSDMRMNELTCVNHTETRYLSKNPWIRGIHLVTPSSPENRAPGKMECACPFSDLRVIPSPLTVMRAVPELAERSRLARLA